MLTYLAGRQRGTASNEGGPGDPPDCVLHVRQKRINRMAGPEELRLNRGMSAQVTLNLQVLINSSSHSYGDTVFPSPGMEDHETSDVV